MATHAPPRLSANVVWVRLLLVLLVMFSQSVLAADGADAALAWTKLVEQLRRPDVGAQVKVRAVRAFIAAKHIPLRRMKMALVFRASADLASGKASPAGSYWRRVTAVEVEQLTGLLGSKKLINSERLGVNILSSQKKLDDAWLAKDQGAALDAANEVIDAIAPVRDELYAFLSVSEYPKQYLTQVLQLSASEGSHAHDLLVQIAGILFELVVEADLIVVDFSGRSVLEEFLQRYPTHLYAASVAYALGRLHEANGDLHDASRAFEILRSRFPNHPLAEAARGVAKKSIVDEK